MSVAVYPNEISSFVGALYATAIKRCSEDVEELQLNGNFRRFAIARMGSTGSTWLAKLLNSHPEVFCSHEGIIQHIYPANEYGSDDIGEFLQYLAWDTKHEAYKAVGDVGSVWAWHLAELPFTTALLVRHPARMLNTRLRVYAGDQSFTRIDPNTQIALRSLWGIELSRLEPIDQIFLQDLWIFTLQMWAVDKVDAVIRIEDLSNLRYCKSMLKRITGLDYEGSVIARAIERPSNERSGFATMPISDIVGAFSRRQLQWYKAILSSTIAAFGYELFTNTVTQAFTTCV